MPGRTNSQIARIGMVLLPSLIVLVCVAVTTGIAVAVQEHSIRAVTAERVHDVAESLAELDQVRDALLILEADDDLSAATRALQPLSDVVERSAGVDYVVITDDHGIRVTHPTPDERGRPVSTDLTEVLAGEEFLGTETGTIGTTLRAKVPVRDGGTVIGTLSVGILESRIAEDFDEALRQLLPWAVGALIAGTLSSSLIAAALELRFRRLDEAAREVEGLRRTSAALHEQSHEFCTRLHVIHGLVSHGDDEEALDYISDIAPVLTAPSGHAFSDRPLLRATIEALSAELGAAGTRLTVSADTVSEIDEEIVLVLANLCRNASEAGATRVRCRLIEEGDTLHGSIDDDGPGIDPDRAEFVFTRGYTSKPEKPGVGHGIGLDLVRRTVIRRGGSIELDRSDLGGARFRFEMAVKQ